MPWKAVLVVGNALNGSSFRGGARGFQLEALLKVCDSQLSNVATVFLMSNVKMKETKTARGGSDCPTLLHYLARVLLRTDPSLVTFIEDLPHLEAAARGKSLPILIVDIFVNPADLVSVQTITQSVNALVSGLNQVNEEIKQLKQLKSLAANDQFVRVMQVINFMFVFMILTDIYGSPSSPRLIQVLKP
jgi:diaphanous 1